MTITIFGAGLAGLIAARMLSDRHPVVMEKQSSLPNNHHAVLRFRSSSVGDATNVPFTKVSVTKHVLADAGDNPIAAAASYSRKVTGLLHSRSVIDVAPVERYVAPKDFISRLAVTANIQLGTDFLEWSHNMVRPHGPMISTIPVPAMMDMFKWKDVPHFKYRKGWVIKAKINPFLDCRIHATVYSARLMDLWYRASITGDELMVEGAGDVPDGGEAMDVLFAEVAPQFGLRNADIAEWNLYQSKYQKIADLTSPERESVKRFVMHLSNEHQIYSLGRFATWRPKLLLDDLVNDIRVIARLIDGESLYNENLNKKG